MEKTKKDFRRSVLAARKAMDPAEVRRASEIICGKVRETKDYRDATSLCVYMPINNEVEADLLIPLAKADGKKVYIPKVIDQEMIFNRCDDPADLVEGPFHIRESVSEEVLEPDGNTLIIMPGSVFDLLRNRIGYGGGYYDRYLSRYPQCRTMAVCFDLQVVESLPAEEFDIRPDTIISETWLIDENGVRQA